MIDQVQAVSPGGAPAANEGGAPADASGGFAALLSTAETASQASQATTHTTTEGSRSAADPANAAEQPATSGADAADASGSSAVGDPEHAPEHAEPGDPAAPEAAGDGATMQQAIAGDSPPRPHGLIAPDALPNASPSAAPADTPLAEGSGAQPSAPPAGTAASPPDAAALAQRLAGEAAEGARPMQSAAEAAPAATAALDGSESIGMSAAASSAPIEGTLEAGTGPDPGRLPAGETRSDARPGVAEVARPGVAVGEAGQSVREGHRVDPQALAQTSSAEATTAPRTPVEPVAPLVRAREVDVEPRLENASREAALASEGPVSDRGSFGQEGGGRGDARPSVPPALAAPGATGDSAAAFGAERASAGAREPTQLVSRPVEGVTAQVAWMAERGGGNARIRLHPAHLGEIDVRVSLRGASVEIVVVAAEAAGRVALEDQRGALAQALGERSLQVAGISVLGPETDAGFDPRAGGRFQAPADDEGAAGFARNMRNLSAVSLASALPDFVGPEVASLMSPEHRIDVRV